jgi:transcriptional regulator with XRE-family HTH domain
MDKMTPEQPLKAIGSKIRSRMADKGFGIDSLSELTGVAKNTIILIRRGENTTLSTLIKLMIPLEMDFGDFKDVIGTASRARAKGRRKI